MEALGSSIPTTECSPQIRFWLPSQVSRQGRRHLIQFHRLCALTSPPWIATASLEALRTAIRIAPHTSRTRTDLQRTSQGHFAMMHWVTHAPVHGSARCRWNSPSRCHGRRSLRRNLSPPPCRSVIAHGQRREVSHRSDTPELSMRMPMRRHSLQPPPPLQRGECGLHNCPRCDVVSRWIVCPTDSCALVAGTAMFA